MTDKAADKKLESITALKNANKHLADLFTDLNKKDLTLSSVANDLLYIARQCGELKVSVYVGNNRSDVLLKTYLEACAKTLSEAR